MLFTFILFGFLMSLTLVQGTLINEDGTRVKNTTFLFLIARIAVIGIAYTLIPVETNEIYSIALSGFIWVSLLFGIRF